MLPQYTFALGGTDAVKKVIDFLEGQRETVKRIVQQKEVEEGYKL